MSAYLFAWENEDGDAWVEVAMEADRDRAGQRLADQTGIIHTFEGRGPISTQDCECVPTHGTDPLDAHRGRPCFDHEGEACVVRSEVDCWHFQSWDEPNPRIEADIAADYVNRDEAKFPIFRPTVPRVEAPGQLAAFAEREAE